MRKSCRIAPMAHVFISYHHSDHLLAEAVEANLRAEGLETWRDQELPAGESWRDGIDDAIREAAAMVVILSPAAQASPYVNYEWAFAFGAGLKPIPLLLGLSEKELHPRLAHSEVLNFTDRPR